MFLCPLQQTDEMAMEGEAYALIPLIQQQMLFSDMHQKPLKLSRKLATTVVFKDLPVVAHIFSAQQTDLHSTAFYVNHMNFCQCY